MIYVIVGYAALIAYELPGLIKHKDAKEIAAAILLAAAGMYYFICSAMAVEAWSPFAEFIHWVEDGLGLSYAKMF